MKNKLVILSLLLAGSATIATAQTKEKFTSESWKDNIFVSVGVGAQATTNPDTDFGKAISPLINVSVGKFINPVFGFRGQVYGWESKMSTWYPFKGSQDVKRKEKYFGINLDGMVNLTNLICGYKPGRAFEFTAFIGPSMNIVKNYSRWSYGYQTVETTENGTTTYTTKLDPNKTVPAGHKLRCLVGASLGLGGKYNINDAWAIDLELRGQVTPSILGAYSSAKTDGYLHLTAGATYTFGGKKFVSCSSKKLNEAAINENVNKYREELEQAQQELAQTKNALANVKPEVREVVKENVIVNPIAVFFKIGSSKIDDYGMVNIKLLAKAMKANPKTKYKVAGYADKATGSEATNKRLSEARAKAVCDALISEGVNPDQLECVGFGGTKDMFGKAYLNRVVILE